MKFTDIPTERTTALTDLLLGLVAVGVSISLYRLKGSTSTPKIDIWLYAVALLGFASLLGSVVHGFALPLKLRFWLWQPLNLALGLVIALFVIAAVFDIWGEDVYRKVMLPLIGLAVIFYFITLLIPGTFLTFIAYETFAMFFALAGYFYLAVKKQLQGAWWMVAGIFITILAAVIQAIGKNGEVILLGLDHNGVFHLIQLFGILALMIGLSSSF